MVFVFNEDKTVSITMDGYVIDLLEALSDVMGEADTPASKNLFRIREECTKLGDEEKDFFTALLQRFYTWGKRVRPYFPISLTIRE